jgi:DNA-binding MarR family transcriptional regulator
MSTTHVGAALHAPADISPVERLVLVLLADVAGPDGVAFPAVSRLAAAANVADSTVSRVLRRLVELKLIARTPIRTGLDAPTAYRLIGGQV